MIVLICSRTILNPQSLLLAHEGNQNRNQRERHTVRIQRCWRQLLQMQFSQQAEQIEELKASEKFTLGQRVQMTQAAIDQGLHGHIANRRTGIVTGFPLSEKYQEPDVLVRVLRDGERFTHVYHMNFWQAEVETTQPLDPLGT